MRVGLSTGKRREREASVPTRAPTPGREPASKRARLQAKETCAAFPDLNTVEGQDAFFHMIGVEGIEQCFREDLRNVEQLYWQKAAEHAQSEDPAPIDQAPVRDAPVRIHPTRFANAKTQPVTGDGDCALAAICAGATHLGDRVVAKLPSTPAGMRQQMVAHVEREYVRWRDTPASDMPDEKQYLAVLPRDDHERHRMLAQLATPGSWHHDIGDLYVAIAADTFDLQIEVLTRYADHEHPLVFGAPDPHKPRLVLRLEGGHYETVVD
ncbi:OTU domain-containing protein [Rhizobacter sp. SG703]|uniref:OTU domain-containing protein n=1 Tax=Rhizobacter sp. SG703 TaxID=2587140 RepID=UPI001446C783|nr:OTU domain-containing protein [Rhizobacter sp. SG703]NKI95539.1 hypothetical protein [Rhizobacter sp. SG703]